ncbi:MAG: hypothetical protein ISR91_04960, partial [Candidatus Delongbacteria bacterium]|nr:hypothetical protein [Candidatus Delongbacteria bacterium]
MKKYTLASCLVISLTITGIAFGFSPQTSPISLSSADLSHCLVEVQLPDNNLTEINTADGLFHAIEQDNMFPVVEPGDPALLALAWTLEIPATAAVQYQLEYEVTLLENVNLLPETADTVPGDPIEFSSRWLEDRFFPESILSISDPAIMRNHRLVQVNLTPYQYNPVTRVLRIYHNIQVDFTFNGENPTNQLERVLPRSATFEQMLQENVLNYAAMNQDARDFDLNLGLDPILYIYNSSALSYLSPLLEWKRQKGHTVYTATQADVGLNSSAGIKSYLQTAYNSWANPPVFVALVGDPTNCAFGDVVASNSTGDHDYSRLEGGDILGDVFVGRLSVDTYGQLQNVVNKQLLYEKTPNVDSPSWLSSAHLVGDDSHTGMSAVFTNENIRYQMQSAGISNVSTCYSYLGCNNEVTSITNAFNDGILYFNYRGYWGMSGWDNYYANQLSNGEQLPFVVTITCGTGDFVSGTALSEGFYQAGTQSTPRGGVAAIGTATTGTHTRYNNIVDLGIFGGIFGHNFPTAGEALFQGKFELWQAYHAISSGNVTSFSNWNNLMGDPSLELRLANPRPMTVNHTGYLVSGATSYAVEVLNSGTPIPDAVVCLYQASGAQVKMTTDATGQVLLPLDGHFTSGNVTLTVTKRDVYPYSDPMDVITENLWVDVSGGTLDDDHSGNSSGNNDGLLNPAEEIELTLTLTNLGTVNTASSVEATLSCDDPRITLTQDFSTFGNMAPGNSASSNSVYHFAVDGAVDSALPPQVALNVAISTSGGDFTGILLLDLLEPLLRVEQLETDPSGDDYISRGETGELYFELYNWGSLASGTLNATLTSSDPQITIIDGSATISSIAMDASGQNSTPFLVRPDGDIFNGHTLPLTLTLENSDAMVMTVTAEFTVGPVGAGDPLGPVEGYYCIDSGDIYYSNYPTYNWVEISGSGTAIPLTDTYDEADDSYAVSLPFNFVYCDNSYSTITICSNGWLAMGNQADQVNYRNYPIPTSIGPDDMIAPFWDDLRVNASGTTKRVYYLNDPANHRFIVEWYRLQQVGPGSPLETFQVILYDQDYQSTDNGDILFQYHTITNNTNNSSTDNSYATVGIENHTQTDGIEYTYYNMYPGGAAPLTNGLAILFTQDPGYFSYDDSLPPVLTHNHQPIHGGNGPFVLEVELSDPSGIDAASLFWSLNGVNFTETSLTPAGGNSWEATVPMQALGTTVWYYFWARDASTNFNEVTSETWSFINGNIEVYFAVDVEDGDEGWTHSSPGGWVDQWHISTEDSYSPSHSWKCGDSGTGNYTEELDARLVLPELAIYPNTVMNFRHRLQAEISGIYPDSAYDGGILEISTDGGDNWEL